MAFESIQEILETCEGHSLKFWEAVLEDDLIERGSSRRESLDKMRSLWEAMVTSADSYDGSLKSASGLTGGAGALMGDYLEKCQTLCGNFVSQVIMRALQMGESNACMKRIVAAPTAGACGVLPAVLVTANRELKLKEQKMLEALYVSAGIGQVIASRAYIAGAAGGCQAEIGSASSMAAGALVHLKGGSAKQISDAAAMAMKNLLGLVCDPVAGLVEVPCVKRNVIGAVNALACADMALAGIPSFIPADQVFDAMREIGDVMHPSLKETAAGGLAHTAAAKAVSEKYHSIE